MKSITICSAFYENAGMLKRQIEHFQKLPKNIREHLNLIVVDDGTGAPKARPDGSLIAGARASSAAPALPCDIGFPFDVYRMKLDIRWNQDACRNLAVSRAITEWILLIDIDHIVPEETLRALITEVHSTDSVYLFARQVVLPNGQLETFRPAPNLFFLTRQLYWRVGGYDEFLRGKYGTDGDMRRRLFAASPPIYLPQQLHFVTPRIIPDACTTSYSRKNPDLDGDLQEIIEKRNQTPEWKPLHFRTEWEKVG